MDIKTQAVADRATLHVKGADGVPMYDDGKPVRITLHGPGSQAAGVVDTRQTNRALKRMSDNDGKVAAGTADERRVETAADLADMTIGFENISYDGLQGVELFRAVYGDPNLGFIVAQVSKFLRDWSAFKPASSAS